MGACEECNNGFAPDEEYLACLLEVAAVGSTDPAKVRRPSVAAILRRSPKLRARFEAAKVGTGEAVSFAVEEKRVRNVVLKLARGHAGFELSAPCRHEPTRVDIVPVVLVPQDAWEAFDAAHFPHLLPEVGSRASQRMMVIQPTVQGPDGSMPIMPPFIMQDWQDVQEGRYRYLATSDGGEVRVRIVLGEYLACDVRWANDSD